MSFESYTPPVLATSRLRLEPLRSTHADLLFEPLSTPHLYPFIPQDPPGSVEALRQRYQRLETRRSADGTELWLNWVAFRDGGPAGLVEATVTADGTAQIAYFVFAEHQRQGIGREGVEAVLSHLRAKLGIRRCRALVDTRNLSSIGLLEALGFKRARTIQEADHFKGRPSDEFEYLRSEEAAPRAR